MVLAENRSAKDVLSDMQNLGPGCMRGWNGMQGKHRRLVLIGSRRFLKSLSRRTSDFGHRMEGAVLVESDELCSRGTTSED